MVGNRERVKAYLLINAATLMWAGNVVLARGLRDAVGPWSLALWRAALATCWFALALRWRGEPLGPVSRRQWLLTGAMAVTGVLGFQVLQYAGLHHTTALNAGLMNATGPVLTLLGSGLLIAHRVRRGELVGALLSLVGVAVILSGASPRALWQLRFNRGDLLVLAAAACWSLYSITARVATRQRTTLWVTAVSTALAVPLLAGPALYEMSRTPPDWSWGLLGAALYIASGPSFLAFLAWNEGVRRVGPTGAMAFYNTLPLYAGVLAAAALGEWPGWPEWFGGGLVIAGCLWAARQPGHR